MDNHHCEAIELSDGRRLACSVTGPADGYPVLYCHGAIGTPIEATVDLRRVTNELGIRYIAPSRPGVGESAPSHGRRIADFAIDAGELADALGLEQFAVVGVSAGGPYALAIGHQLGDRVQRIALCSSLSPMWPPHRAPGMRRRIRVALAALRGCPGLWRALGDAVLPVLARHPELIVRAIAAHAAPGEQVRLACDGERRAAITSFLDATRAGVGGLIDDYRTYTSAWGFGVEDVDCEVHLWHGGADPLVPIEHALQLASALPSCRVFIDPDEGHHFFRSSLEQILTALVGRDPRLTAGMRTTLDSARALCGQAAARSSASGGR